MKTLLRIDASARAQGSCSRRLADHFQRRWTAAHPGGRVVLRDLAQDPVPHLDGATLDAFYGVAGPGQPAAGLDLSDRLIEELRSADHLLLASPMHNLTLSSALKAYIDHVVRVGQTFAVVGGRRVGLLAALSVTLVTARGGLAAPDGADDLHVGYLRAILGFVGVEKIAVVAVDGTAQDDGLRAQRLAQATARIDGLFAAGQGFE